MRETFEDRAEDIVEIVKLGVFVVFGSLLTFDGLFDDGWAAVAIVVFTLLVARPVAVWLALAGTGSDAPTKAFMAWFGPKGVATMTFSLLVLGHAASPPASASSTSRRWSSSARSSLHGLTDTPGADWIARHAERAAAKTPQRREARPAPARSGRPRLPGALLAEDEAQLARRAQALGAVGPEGRAGRVEVEGAEPVGGSSSPRNAAWERRSGASPFLRNPSRSP